MKVFKKAAFALLAPVALVFGQTTVAPPSAAPGQGSQTITGVQARPEPGRWTASRWIPPSPSSCNRARHLRRATASPKSCSRQERSCV